MPDAANRQAKNNHALKPQTSKKDYRPSLLFFEAGLTTGPSFGTNSYLAFEYCKKTKGPLHLGMYMSYGVYKLREVQDYSTDFTDLNRLIVHTNSQNNTSSTFATYNTRVIDYQIDHITLTEIGLSARYPLGARITLRAMATYVAQQSIWGQFAENSIDSTFKTTDGERTFHRDIETLDNGKFRRNNSAEDIGLGNYFFLHGGIDYRISKRGAITAKVGIPISEVFPNSIRYDHFGKARNVMLSKGSTHLPKRPAFVQIGLSINL